MAVNQIIVAVVLAVISYVLQPKIKDQGAPPTALADFNVPTATEDRVIPQVFGRRLCESPNVVWYGKLKSHPIRQ